MNKQNTKHAFRWYHALAIWTALLLVAGLIGCIVLYKYLGVYEISRPESEMENILSTEGPEGLRDLAKESLNPDDFPFEDIDTLFDSYFNQFIKGKELSYREEKSARTNECAVYVIRAGATPFCRVTLTAEPGTDLGFGRHYWQLDSVSAKSVIESLDSVTVQIDSVLGTEFTLNGRTVGDEYITETGAEAENITDLEKRFSQQPTATRYEVGPIYGEVEVKDSEGNVVSPVDETGSVIAYQLTPETHTVTITAPADVTVNICGADLTEADASSISQGVFEGLDAYTNGENWQTAVYYFEGLYQKPEVTVTDAAGNSLQPVITDGERFYYTHADAEYDPYYETLAQSFFSTYMNYSSYGTLDVYLAMQQKPDFDMSVDGGYYITLLGKILYGTDLYNYISGSFDAMIWASQTATEYNDITYGNFCKVNDTCFTCTVTYSADMTASAWEGQYSYNLTNAYQLVFVNNGYWKCAVMQDLAA